MGKHLSEEQRYRIYALQGFGLTQAAIAAAVGSNQSVVSREMKRNRGGRGYRPRQAQALASQRRSAASSVAHIMTAPVVALIESKLRDEQLSPEQISGWMRKTQTITVSHEWIYQHIYADQRAGGTLYRELRRTGKSYNKRKGKTSGRGLIPNRTDISERPAIVEERSRIGDWEADTIVGARHKGAILSLVERTSRYTLLHKLEAATSANTTAAILAKLLPHRKKCPHHHRRQWQGVCRPPGGCRRAGNSLLFCDPLSCLGARAEREHQRSRPPVLPERLKPR